MEVKDYLKNVFYDDAGQMLFANHDDHGCLMVAEIRGWGALTGSQYNLPEDVAAKFQDKMGQFIADAIKEKLCRET